MSGKNDLSSGCDDLTDIKQRRDFFRLSRFWVFNGLVLIAIYLALGENIRAQSFGPPAILLNGSFCGWGQTLYDDSRGFSYDQYAGVEIDQNYQVRDANNPDNIIGSYDPSNFTFTPNSLVAATNSGQAIRPPPPQRVAAAVGGSSITYNLSGVNFTSGADWYWEELNYQDASGSLNLTLHRYYNGGAFSGDLVGAGSGDIFNGTFDPVAVTATVTTDTAGLLPIDITFPAPVIQSRQGPPYISWSGALLTYSSTDSNGNDFYFDASNSIQVTINNGSSTTGSGPSGGVSGTYNVGTQTFSGINTSNFFALDDSRNPVGLPTGLLVNVGYSGFGTSILVANGVSVSASAANYTYQKSDGTWIAEYTGIPVDSRILIADNLGNFNSQIFLTADTTAQNQVINAVSGWPPTNIYPAQVYVNDVLCQIQPATQYDSGGGLPRHGGVSYRAEIYDLTAILGWSWDASTGFRGFVTGKYGQSTSFKGSWDGLNTFSNVTGGVVVSVAVPASVPTDGNPPQISVNGTALQYNSVASTALSNAGTPGDVYSGPLGQQLTINPSTGAVSYIPGMGIAAVPGTYNATTHQFSFGTTGNTVTVTNTDGSTSNSVITATDLGGHNLADFSGSSGVSSNGSVTEINGGLDVQGNNFTLGSWTDPSQASIPGFLLSFTPPSGTDPSLLRFGSPISVANWVWSHAVTDGATTHQTVMQLDPANRLSLFSPTNGTTPTIIFDPAGVSLINGAIQIAPQGDVLMGEFGN